MAAVTLLLPNYEMHLFAVLLNPLALLWCAHACRLTACVT
jgi:hypothetical protein